MQTELSRDSELAADDLAVLAFAFEAVLAVGLRDLVPEVWGAQTQPAGFTHPTGLAERGNVTSSA